MAAHLPSQRPNTEAGLLSTLASAISISGGASVGQYGPLVHFGGVIGDYFSKLTRDQTSPHILLACGVAAAVSSGFGAPFAGLVFAHEVIVRHFSLKAVAPILISSVVAHTFSSEINTSLGRGFTIGALPTGVSDLTWGLFKGEIGEVIVTSLNPDYPLIRFATGDLSAIAPGLSSCGRTNTRIVGWRGRADQAAKVKGMFLRPEQIKEFISRNKEILKVRAEISLLNNQDDLTIKIEVNPDNSFDYTSNLRDIINLRANILKVKPNSLPKDGVVIDDKR